MSAANYGSAGILPITWAYLALMGADGLTAATKTAVLAANYLAAALTDRYPVLYTGESGLVAHECILDLREITKRTGVTAEDVAKRLIDYGFHAPTLSFPVNGTLMVEPTESEDIAELDRFITAMIAIHDEIAASTRGSGRSNTARCVRPRTPPSRSPTPSGHCRTAGSTRRTRSASLRLNKYWPPVRRIDGVHGDRNLVCSCPAPEAFQIRHRRGPRGGLTHDRQPHPCFAAARRTPFAWVRH